MRGQTRVVRTLRERVALGFVMGLAVGFGSDVVSLVFFGDNEFSGRGMQMTTLRYALFGFLWAGIATIFKSWGPTRSTKKE